MRATRIQDLLRRAVGLVEDAIPLGRGGSDLLDVGQPMGLAGELVVLARLRVGGGQLVALEGEQVALASTPLGRLDQGDPPLAERVVRLAGRSIGEQDAVELAVGVEEVALALGFEQRPPLVLAVDVDQAAAELP